MFFRMFILSRLKMIRILIWPYSYALDVGRSSTGVGLWNVFVSTKPSVSLSSLDSKQCADFVVV